MASPTIDYACTYCGKMCLWECQGCKTAHYCSVEHQKADWPRHRRDCGSINRLLVEARGWKARRPFIKDDLSRMKYKLEQLTSSNDYYRRVIATTAGMQLVLMYLQAGEMIPKERHKNTVQFFRLEKGVTKAGKYIPPQMKITMWTMKRGKMDVLTTHYLDEGDALIVPAGVWHEVQAITGCKLYTIYSPPEHPEGTEIKNNPESRPIPGPGGEEPDVKKNWPTKEN